MQIPFRNMKTITVFGGSILKDNDINYKRAVNLGQFLGGAGLTVMTGGYIGTMEAVSKGASESGGSVIGVTCDEIEAWRPLKPNRWINQEYRFSTIIQRAYALIEKCDIALALPGGAGTLTEISLMWNFLITEIITPRPLILIGDGWSKTFHSFFDTFGAYTPDSHRQYLTFSPNIDTTIAMLSEQINKSNF